MSFTTRDFRHAMGQFCTGVTVVTTEHEGTRGGMTVSSLSSVSLDPVLLLWCAEKTSRTHALVESSGTFAVSVLSAEMQQLSNRFATPGQTEEQLFGDLEVQTSETGSPILPGSLAWFDCKVRYAHAGGDHTIFVGEVLSLGVREGDPLLYFRGGYHDLAKKD